jgi:hypothetical protein
MMMAMNEDTPRSDEILAIELRRLHRVYRDGRNGFFVEIEDGHGATHTNHVSAEASDWLGRRLAGSTTTRKEAAGLLEPVADELGLPFQYGYKLDYYAQDILLTLVAEGRATVERAGRGYEYRVIR